MKIDENPNIEAAVFSPEGFQYTGRYITVGGWGQKGAYSGATAVHQTIEISVKETNECKETLSFFDERNHFCAGDKAKSACKGDSGSGSIYTGWSKPIIFGVVSFGAKESCSKATAFEDVRKSIPWIFRVTGLR